MSYRVVFTDGGRHCEIDLDGPPLVLPPSLRVERRGPAWVEVVPRLQGIGTGEMDVLVGDLPLLVASGQAVSVEWLSLEPPLPLLPGDLAAMWDRIVEQGCPIPTSIRHQGLGSETGGGRPSDGTPELELLPNAHSAAIGLLAHWPLAETTKTVWRPVDIPGGREDLKESDLRGGRWPSISRRDGVVIPQRTARTVPSTSTWSSVGLSTTAALVSLRLRELIDASVIGDPALVEPFDRVSRRSWPSPVVPDAPLSSWPAAARHSLALMRALLAIADATRAGGRRTALSYLWRLYEAWVAVEVLSAVRTLEGVHELVAPALGDGCEWHAEFQVGGERILIAAQPQLAGTPESCPALEVVGLRSVTSTLRPDVLLAHKRSPETPWVVTVLDAKHRIGGAAMDPAAVAESGSKYLWGLRRPSDGEGAETFGVDQVIIVSTEQPAGMFDAAGQIDGWQFLPTTANLSARVRSIFEVAAG